MSVPTVFTLGPHDDGWSDELRPCAERIAMCLFEAGYPDATVWIQPTGIFVAGAPEPVIEKAMEVANR